MAAQAPEFVVIGNGPGPIDLENSEKLTPGSAASAAAVAVVLEEAAPGALKHRAVKGDQAAEIAAEEANLALAPLDARVAHDLNRVTFIAPNTAAISLALFHAAGVPDEIYNDINASGVVGPEGTTVEVAPGLRFPYLAALEEATKELAKPEDPVIPEARLSSCSAGVRKVLFYAGDRGAGLISLAYGVGFGAMVFSIADSLPEAIWARAMIFTTLAVLFLFSAFVNYLQANDSFRTVVPDVYHRISPVFGRFPKPIKMLGSVASSLLLVYGAILPAAAITSTTVRHGMLTMFGVPIAEQGMRSVDNNAFEAFMEIIRAFFLLKTLATVGDALRLRARFMNDRNNSLVKRIAADWALPVSLGIAGIYGWTISDKALEAVRASVFRHIYPEGETADLILQCLGTITNSVVAAKLLLSGILSLLPAASKRYGVAVGFALVACCSGLATGLASGVRSMASLSGGGDIVLNLVYATIANVSFLMKATNATEVLALKRSAQILTDIFNVLKDRGSGSGVEAVKADITRVLEKMNNAIKLAEASGGFQQLGIQAAKPITNLFHCDPVRSLTPAMSHGQVQIEAMKRKRSNAGIQGRSTVWYTSERGGSMQTHLLSENDALNFDEFDNVDEVYDGESGAALRQ